MWTKWYYAWIWFIWPKSEKKIHFEFCVNAVFFVYTVKRLLLMIMWMAHEMQNADNWKLWWTAVRMVSFLTKIYYLKNRSYRSFYVLNCKRVCVQFKQRNNCTKNRMRSARGIDSNFSVLVCIGSHEDQS